MIYTIATQEAYCLKLKSEFRGNYAGQGTIPLGTDDKVIQIIVSKHFRSKYHVIFINMYVNPFVEIPLYQMQSLRHLNTNEQAVITDVPRERLKVLFSQLGISMRWVDEKVVHTWKESMYEQIYTF